MTICFIFVNSTENGKPSLNINIDFIASQNSDCKEKEIS